MAKNEDRLRVNDSELVQPPTPPKVSISAVMRNSITCDAHHNRMAMGHMNYTVAPGTGNGVAVRGDVQLSFIGCNCRYRRGLK